MDAELVISQSPEHPSIDSEKTISKKKSNRLNISGRVMTSLDFIELMKQHDEPRPKKRTRLSATKQRSARKILEQSESDTEPENAINDSEGLEQTQTQGRVLRPRTVRRLTQMGLK